MPDLLAALELVTGPPFAQHPAGYEWLGGLASPTPRPSATSPTRSSPPALDGDDRDIARTASATALLVAPDDGTVLLSAMWVAVREGNQAEAEAYA